MSRLVFDGIMCGMLLSGVGLPRGFSASLEDRPSLQGSGDEVVV